MNGKIYMNVSYAEKEIAKAMGAKWDAKLKKWYYEGPIKNYTKFAKWIACGRELTIIAHEYIYIVEGVNECFKCKKPTRVIGLGIGEHTTLFQDDVDNYEIEIIEDLVGYEPLFVAWVENENEIPPALLKYLTKYYNVHNGYSKTAGKCFANHCDHCGVIQGNYYLFEEDSPLTAFISDGPELKERLSKLKIYNIGIDEDLVLDWNFGYGENDGLYFKYAKSIDLKLPQSKYEDVITYQELYEL